MYTICISSTFSCCHHRSRTRSSPSSVLLSSSTPFLRSYNSFVTFFLLFYFVRLKRWHHHTCDVCLPHFIPIYCFFFSYICDCFRKRSSFSLCLTLTHTLHFNFRTNLIECSAADAEIFGTCFNVYRLLLWWEDFAFFSSSPLFALNQS